MKEVLTKLLVQEEQCMLSTEGTIYRTLLVGLGKSLWKTHSHSQTLSENPKARI